MSRSSVILKIFRFDPDGDYAPEYKTYEVPWQDGLLLLQAVKYVRDYLDDTLSFRDYCCGCSWCMSCMMMVNGQGMRTCSRPLVPEEKITVEPMKGYPIIKDLAVDFGISINTPEGVFKKMEGTVLRKVKV